MLFILHIIHLILPIPQSDPLIPGRALSCGADEALRPASPMSMSQINTFSHQITTADGPVITPCTVTCINLQTMHPLVQQRLNLQYKKFYVMNRYEVNTSPNHFGAWVQLAGVGEVQSNGSREWIPAALFVINSVIWRN